MSITWPLYSPSIPGEFTTTNAYSSILLQSTPISVNYFAYLSGSISAANQFSSPKDTTGNFQRFNLITSLIDNPSLNFTTSTLPPSFGLAMLIALANTNTASAALNGEDLLTVNVNMFNQTAVPSTIITTLLGYGNKENITSIGIPSPPTGIYADIPVTNQDADVVAIWPHTATEAAVGPILYIIEAMTFTVKSYLTTTNLTPLLPNIAEWRWMHPNRPTCIAPTTNSLVVSLNTKTGNISNISTYPQNGLQWDMLRTDFFTSDIGGNMANLNSMVQNPNFPTSNTVFEIQYNCVTTPGSILLVMNPGITILYDDGTGSTKNGLNTSRANITAPIGAAAVVPTIFRVGLEWLENFILAMRICAPVDQEGKTINVSPLQYGGNLELTLRLLYRAYLNCKRLYLWRLCNDIMRYRVVKTSVGTNTSISPLAGGDLPGVYMCLLDGKTDYSGVLPNATSIPEPNWENLYIQKYDQFGTNTTLVKDTLVCLTSVEIGAYISASFTSEGVPPDKFGILRILADPSGNGIRTFNVSQIDFTNPSVNTITGEACFEDQKVCWRPFLPPPPNPPNTAAPKGTNWGNIVLYIVLGIVIILVIVAIIYFLFFRKPHKLETVIIPPPEGAYNAIPAGPVIPTTSAIPPKQVVTYDYAGETYKPLLPQFDSESGFYSSASSYPPATSAYTPATSAYSNPGTNVTPATVGTNAYPSSSAYSSPGTNVTSTSGGRTVAATGGAVTAAATVPLVRATSQNNNNNSTPATNTVAGRTIAPSTKSTIVPTSNVSGINPINKSALVAPMTNVTPINTIPVTNTIPITNIAPVTNATPPLVMASKSNIVNQPTSRIATSSVNSSVSNQPLTSRPPPPPRSSNITHSGPPPAAKYSSSSNVVHSGPPPPPKYSTPITRPPPLPGSSNVVHSGPPPLPKYSNLGQTTSNTNIISSNNANTISNRLPPPPASRYSSSNVHSGPPPPARFYTKTSSVSNTTSPLSQSNIAPTSNIVPTKPFKAPPPHIPARPATALSQPITSKSSLTSTNTSSLTQPQSSTFKSSLSQPVTSKSSLVQSQVSTSKSSLVQPSTKLPPPHIPARPTSANNIKSSSVPQPSASVKSSSNISSAPVVATTNRIPPKLVSSSSLNSRPLPLPHIPARPANFNNSLTSSSGTNLSTSQPALFNVSASG
jgi:hypothetical protein